MPETALKQLSVQFYLFPNLKLANLCPNILKHKGGKVEDALQGLQLQIYIVYMCKGMNTVLNTLSMTEKCNKAPTLREKQPCKQCQGTGHFCILSKELYSIFNFPSPVRFGECSPAHLAHSPHGFEFQSRAWRFHTAWSWALGRKIKPSFSFCKQSDQLFGLILGKANIPFLVLWNVIVMLVDNLCTNF